jgi:ATP-dependent helicase/nuclease subunit B
MRRLIFNLAKECESDKLTEKILLTPSYNIGYQILESLALLGTNVINLRIYTPLGLVLDCGHELLLKTRQSLISNESRISLIEELFREAIYRKEGLYFDELEPKTGIIGALANSINDLRLAEVNPLELTDKSFVSKEKYCGVSLLLKKYEEYLASSSLIDEAGIYQLFLKNTDYSPSKLRRYFILPEISLKPLQLKCLEIISKNTLIVLDAETIIDLPRSRQFPVSSRQDGLPQSNMSWMLVPSRLPKELDKVDLGFYHAAGISAEVKEVLRRIHSKRYQFDTVEVACTDYLAYANQFLIEQQKRNIPITFSDGVPCSYSRPGKALLGLLDWIESDYAVTSLRYLLASNTLQKKVRNGVNSQEIIRILRSAKIGWSRDRYLPMIKSLAESYRTRNNISDESIDRRSKEKTEGKIESIKNTLLFIEDLFACIPLESEGKIAIKDLVAGFGRYCGSFCSQQDELDRLAVSALQSVIEECNSIVQPEKQLDEFIKYLRIKIGSLLIGGSGPKPGHMHVSTISKCGYNVRSHHFIVGLDEHRFPGAIKEDPVLLDSERRSISKDLMLSEDTFAENVFRTYSYLSSISGTITMSYTSYDVIENREVFPSPIYLEAYRVATGNPKIDYTKLRNELGDPIGIQASTPLDTTEWWLSSILSSRNTKSHRLEVLDAFPSVARGIVAKNNRNSSEFTHYDGKVSVNPALLDPRRNEGLVMSCTRIEKIANCPFEYFVTEVLGLAQPDDIEFDHAQWIDAAILGSLLHSIYEEFMTMIKATKEKVSFLNHKDILIKIATRHINSMKESIPPPSEHVFVEQKNSILSDLEIFLKMEEKRPKNETPEYFELSFGMKLNERSEFGTEQPIVITVGNYKFQLRGKIDRIDKIGVLQYHVIDYKTGSTYKFKSNGYFNRGTTIQHCLYARAAETILRSGVDKKAKVVLSGYYFPTKKGKADQFIKEQNRPQDVDKIVNLIFDVISKGIFLHSSSGCFLCKDYGLCGDIEEHYKRKTESHNDEGIELITTLNEYE